MTGIEIYWTRISQGLLRWAIAAVVFGPSACSPKTPSKQVAKSVLLFTLDTTRADRLGFCGYEQAKTPVLDGLAARGQVFKHAYATAPITLPSHASILTGVYPSEHGVRDNAIFQLSEEALLLSEVLHQRGFQTGAFVGSYVLDRRFGLDQGFDVYRGPTPAEVGLDPEVVERPADEVVDDVETWITQLDETRPFFAWVHFYDPHQPFTAPDPWPQRVQDPYDAEIAFVDHEIGRLRRILDEHGLTQELLTVVTADHGESLGEHKEDTHGIFVYDATMHVPLLFVSPDLSLPAQRIDAGVSITDIAPTILELLGFPPKLQPQASGTSLVGFMQNPAAANDQPLYVESFLPYYSFRWRPLQGIVWQHCKYIHSGSPELYDLKADPHELRNIATHDPHVTGLMRRRLDSFVETHRPLEWHAKSRLSTEDQERLAALGYVSESRAAEHTLEELPDPSQRIGDLKELSRARSLLRQGRLLLGLDEPKPEPVPDAGRDRGYALMDAASEIVESLMAHNPEDPSLWGMLGLVRLSQGKFVLAIDPLEQAVAARPDLIDPRYNLAIAYAKTGRRHWCEQELYKLLSVEPRFQPAWLWLVDEYRNRGEFGAAAYCMTQALKDPGISPVQQIQFQGTLSELRAAAAKNRQSQTPAVELPVQDPVPEGLQER